MLFKHNPPIFTVVCATLVVCVLLSSCVTIKNYPANKPFVFANKLVVTGNISKDEKKRLTSELNNYWHDSLLAEKAQVLVFGYTLKKPASFDSLNIIRTIGMMSGYMQSQGYYNAQFQDTFHIDTVRKQLRTTVEIVVLPKKNTEIELITYDFADTSLQRMTTGLSSLRESYLKVGNPFNKQIISSELDRLVMLYRKNGYYLFTREHLIAEVDTSNRALRTIMPDSIEQAKRVIEAVKKQEENPTIDIVIKQRSQINHDYETALLLDSPVLRRYYIGNINYYPELKPTDIPEDVFRYPRFKIKKKDEFSMFYKEGKFAFSALHGQSSIRKGMLYNDNRFFKTITKLNNIGAWAQVDSRSFLREDSIDVNILMIPAPKQNITASLEASYNTGDVVNASSAVGFGLNLTYRNRNAFRHAIQSSTILHGGVELNLGQVSGKFLEMQTVQGAVSQTYTFPKFIIPFKLNSINKLDAEKTVLLANISYIDRTDFFKLQSITVNWGYEWKKRNQLWQYKPINIELYSLDTLPKLDTAFKKNPYLRTAFNTGSIISQILSYSATYPSANNPNHSNYLRLSSELAGTVAGVIPILGNIYRYAKFEAEYKRLIQLPKKSIALRGFVGIGVSYNKSIKTGNTLPFYKQFIAGGPNSMRAWVIRQLGLGSSLISDTSGTFRDRSGDMQLEANIEYRYKIFSIGSIGIDGAVFADVGNIWNLYNDPLNPNSEFSLPRLGKDIAIGIGTGVRFDFSYFVIRVDGAIKFKDPARLENNGWMRFKDFTWRNDEFTVIDPITGRKVNRNNYAIQLGIGLPF